MMQIFSVDLGLHVLSPNDFLDSNFVFLFAHLRCLTACSATPRQTEEMRKTYIP